VSSRARPLARRALLRAGVVLLGSLALPRALAAPTVVHGESDAFATAGAAIAWAVLRGHTDDDAQVVLRVAPDTRAFAWVAVWGEDPFTRRREPSAPAQATTDAVEIRIARTRFADFPRSEVRLYASREALAAESPALVVYYLGVPDTTPEFPSESALRTHLDERIARLRGAKGGVTK
jgi:hypothetical protein